MDSTISSTRTSFTDGQRCDLLTCRKLAWIRRELISAFRAGTILPGSDGAGIGIPGLEPTPLFQRTGFYGVLTDGDSTPRRSSTGPPIFMVRTCPTGSKSFTDRMDMAMRRPEQDAAAERVSNVKCRDVRWGLLN